MKLFPGFLLLIACISCGLDKRMDRLDAGRKKADSIIELLNQDSASNLFSDNYFTPRQVQSIQRPFREFCDWPARRGKFIDFYMKNDDGFESVSYIYEYFLDCDSLRFVLTFDTAKDSVELISMVIEPIEAECDLLVDPMKSILKDKNWEKDQSKGKFN